MAGSGIRIDDRHRTMASLYLEGDPELLGNWNECARRAGFERIPGRETKPINEALRMHAKTMAPTAYTYNPEATPAYAPIDPDIVRLATLDDDDWDTAASVAKRIMRKAIAGHIELTTQQVTLIKETIARSEGRVGQARDTVDEGDVVRVVLLPTIDTEQGPVIDLGEVQDVDPGDHVPGLMLRHAISKTEP